VAGPDPDRLLLARVVELTDRVLERAFRRCSDPDPDVIRHGRIGLTAYCRPRCGRDLPTADSPADGAHLTPCTQDMSPFARAAS
jgi:hypothetical protein